MKCLKSAGFLPVLLLWFNIFGTVYVYAETTDTVKEQMAEEEKAQKKIMENLELEQMQDAVNELLQENTFSVKEALWRVLRGEELFSKEFLWNLLKEFLERHFLADQRTVLQVVFLVFFASLFSNITGIFGTGQTDEISFYVIYMLLLTLLVHMFSGLGRELSDSLQGFLTFMRALMPSYFLAVTAASGSSGAMIFYESVLFVIYIVQMVLLGAVIPGIHAYVLLQMVNFLHKEDLLSKLAELLRTALEWTLNTCTMSVIGMQILQNMISPAVDSLKRDMLQKAAAAVPGIGSAINGISEVALGTAAVIRNCLGAAGILVIVLLGLPPLIRLAANTFLYKLLAALIQPISDTRMTGCLATVGDGCRLLLRVLLTVELLLLITIAILSISFVAH